MQHTYEVRAMLSDLVREIDYCESENDMLELEQLAELFDWVLANAIDGMVTLNDEQNKVYKG